MTGIKQHELAVEMVDVQSIKTYPGNARQGDIDKIAESIDENGFYRPLIVQKSTRYILAGNNTYRAAVERLDLQQVPISIIDVTDKQAKKIVLVDNKLNDDAIYDDAALADLLQSLGGDVDGTGWDEDEIAAVLDRVADTPDFDPEEDDDVRLDRKNVTDCPNCGHTFEPTTRSEVM
ncbi:ParB-like nuclease domain protein [Arthrobacter phage Sicarius2]|uniref:ParB-like nuclease domain protein n=1 Tax=Arthrobacter phage Sicarius2 TaxID=2836090 RepID=A0A8F3E5S8_9CAUD|nr:ParB-like nuclease domain protein [Arthrobacter phage Sicarius2]